MSKIKTAYIRNGVLFKAEREDGIEKFHTSANDIVDHTESLPQEALDQEPMDQEPLPDDPLFEVSPDLEPHTEPPWLRTTTELFLDECVKRKMALRKPSIRRRTLFSDIRLAMKGKGYNFDEGSLDRKFRNLKTHFFYVKKNNNKRKTNRILWPYFDKMNQIFPSEIMRDNRVLSSLRNKSPTVQILQSRTSRNAETLRGSSNRQETTPRKGHYGYKLEKLRNELIVFEERRTIAIEAIAAELVEANRLTREKINLEKKRLEERNIGHDENGDF